MQWEKYEFWFVVGSQFLYGEETLAQVEANSRKMVDGLNASGLLPRPVVYKTTIKTEGGAVDLVREANYHTECAGIIVFCHTFSPSKMWINGLKALQKPYLHFHSQFNRAIPNEGIDMDYMNLHQSAHGDREHGFMAARLQVPRKVVVGYWEDEAPQRAMAKWMRAALGAAFSRQLRVMRFGDNMREVGVTEGDKVGVQAQLGWQVNTWPVGKLVSYIDEVTDAQVAEQLAVYNEHYIIETDNTDSIRYQAKVEIGMKRMLDEQGCQAYTNTFEDLYGMDQLPGLGSQDLMRQGYGYGGEGDWKVSAMTSILKFMGTGLGRGTSFMEDYTYDMEAGLSLGAHMLEVCPSVGEGKARIQVHPLGIGGKEDPARLVFEGKTGPAVLASLVDMGGRLRLIVHDINCVAPHKTMPNLPTARVMWRAEPSLEVGAHCWILAGGSHHSVLSLDIDAETLRDWARIMDVEFVHITKDSTPEELEKDLFYSNLAWKLKTLA